MWTDWSVAVSDVRRDGTETRLEGCGRVSKQVTTVVRNKWRINNVARIEFSKEQHDCCQTESLINIRPFGTTYKLFEVPSTYSISASTHYYNLLLFYLESACRCSYFLYYFKEISQRAKNWFHTLEKAFPVQNRKLDQSVSRCDVFTSHAVVLIRNKIGVKLLIEIFLDFTKTVSKIVWEFRQK